MISSLSSPQVEWIQYLSETLPGYLQTLQLPDQPGRFLPCVQGPTEIGQQAALGFSCFALKLYYMLGLWQTLEGHTQTTWLTFLKSFQAKDSDKNEYLQDHPFIDPPIVAYLSGQVSWSQRLIENVFERGQNNYLQKIIYAETKQAIATLAEVGELSHYPYRRFPVTQSGVKNYLACLDWQKPWGAGGQAAALVVFLAVEAPKIQAFTHQQALLSTTNQFFETLADSNTGGYFKGSVPEFDQLINGAMKILTALDWLKTPIHYPERLIDTCLTRLPSPEGCHLVDIVYVLYRCLQQTNHRRTEVQAYCIKLLNMIKQHRNSDGGFSYYIGRSQTAYYRVPITRGLAESDIHGTCLLTWAMAMALEILESNLFHWQVIKP